MASSLDGPGAPSAPIAKYPRRVVGETRVWMNIAKFKKTMKRAMANFTPNL
jgi:hypothetical protein